ncbi:MAG TPA: glucosaminidase domain-containing protein [Candidatus Limnocylindria bacterium]|jgi:hypothetical protein|nr:glucosaminidase domain-containing protein [Candidatus Limnocylindria bacterium]
MNTQNLVGVLPREYGNDPQPLTQVKDKWTLHWPGEDVDPAMDDNAAVALITRIAQEHINRDWGGGQRGGGIMYHRVIGPTGTVFITRDETDWTWHSSVDGPGGGNRSSIAILVVYGKTGASTSAQNAALDELIATHATYVVYGHRDWTPTTCPGDVLYQYAQDHTDAHGIWLPALAPAPQPPPVQVVPVLGTTAADVERRLGLALLRQNGAASIEAARLYAELAPLAGIRAEIAFAQAMKETAWLTYPRLARPEWNNFAGLGCSEISHTCNVFATAEAGVRAHLGHLLCYFGDHFPAFCSFDQRHDLVGHKHLANDVRELSGKWAPAPDYAERIVTIAASLA